MSEKNLTPRTLAIIITVAALTLAACNNSDSNTSKPANTASTAQPPPRHRTPHLRTARIHQPQRSSCNHRKQ